MSMNKKIGILGGIGPESSALFYTKLIELVQSQGLIKTNIDYPYIVIESIPGPELFLEEPNLTLYKQGVKNLEKVEVDFIVMICNTLHLFWQEMQDCVKVPILNMPEEVEKYLIKKGVKSVLPLGSSSTMRDLFKFKNIKVEKIDESDVLKIDRIIEAYIQGKDKDLVVGEFLAIVNKYEDHNLLMACTELSTMAKRLGLKHFDTMDVMLDVTFDRWYN
jgi:aspartate racemase